MKWHRQQQQDDQHEALLAELVELRAKKYQLQDELSELHGKHSIMVGTLQNKVEDLIYEKEYLVKENTDLKKRLDVERRYLEDTTPRTFKAWLKKQPSSPWRVKFLSDQLVPARGPRSLYEAHVRRLCTEEEERDDFVRLWKLMLLQS